MSQLEVGTCNAAEGVLAKTEGSDCIGTPILKAHRKDVNTVGAVRSGQREVDFNVEEECWFRFW